MKTAKYLGLMPVAPSDGPDWEYQEVNQLQPGLASFTHLYTLRAGLKCSLKKVAV